MMVLVWLALAAALVGIVAYAIWMKHRHDTPKELRGDWWSLNELETALVGEQSGRALRLGDPVRVSVRRVEPARGRADLELAPD